METQLQKIFVWCDFTQTMETAIMHGITVASILKKELCLFYWNNKNKQENTLKADDRLNGICLRINNSLPELPVTFLILYHNQLDLFERLADSYECVMLIIHKLRSTELLSYLEYARFPFLFVSAKENITDSYKHIAFPVGYMKKCKDLALWASYFGRHCNATIDLNIAFEKNQADNIKVQNNLKSILNLFNKFQFPFQTLQSQSSTWKIQRSTLNIALVRKTGLLIVAASYDSTFIDALLGLTEKKIIEKSGDFSVICINSRKDFYTLCC